ncbi:MAG: hypothetical protein R3F59_09225 [Myxococcota bacterium]
MDDAFVFVLVFGIIGAVFGFAFFAWWSSAPQVAKRTLRAMPEQPIGQLRPGQRVKVRGRVVVREALESPFHGWRCAYWQVKVEEKRGKHWHDRAVQHEGRAFFLEDATGRVYVDPAGDRLPLDLDRAGGSGTFDDPTPREEAALVELGIDPTTMLGFNRLLRFHEASLDEGEEVCAAGEVALLEVDGEPVLALVPGQDGLIVSDAPDL